MSLQRCQQETTSTEFLLWIEYLKQKINHPSRSDYYQMQTAAEIRRKLAKNPKAIKLEDLKIPFKTETRKKPTGRLKFYTTREVQDAAAQQKARLFAATGFKRKPE